MMARSRNATTVFLSGLSTLIGTAKALISVLCTDRLALDTQHFHSTPYISYFTLFSLPLYSYLIWSPTVFPTFPWLRCILQHFAASICLPNHIDLTCLFPTWPLFLVSSHFSLLTISSLLFWISVHTGFFTCYHVYLGWFSCLSHDFIISGSWLLSLIFSMITNSSTELVQCSCPILHLVLAQKWRSRLASVVYCNAQRPLGTLVLLDFGIHRSYLFFFEVISVYVAHLDCYITLLMTSLYLYYVSRIIWAKIVSRFYDFCTWYK